MTTESNENLPQTDPSIASPPPATNEEAARPVGKTTDADTKSEAPQTGDESAKPRIKIGTQRSGVVAPKIAPRTQTVFTTPPPDEARATTSPAAETIQQSSITGEAPQQEAAPPDPTASEREKKQRRASDETSETASVESEPAAELPATPAPHARGRKPKRFAFEETGPTIQRPNLRAALSPDLEQELAASLGDLSLDEVLAGDERGKLAAQTLEPESRVKARVVRVHRDDVFVDLPGMNQGTISARIFTEPPAPGTVLDVVVVRFNADEGLYELISPTGTVDIGDWSDIAEGMTVEARITGHNKGGLECEVNRIRGFMPVSQISLYRVEDLESFVGQRMTCVVTEANRDRRNLVLSRRAVLEREQAEAKQRLLAELAEGQEREGVVRNIRDFGAFVDLGGVDGMLHVSQLSWERVKHPSEVLHVGQRIKVKIHKIDQATGKIGLSYRDTFENPWTTAASRYPVTARVKGTVSKIMDFGAFVRLEAGIEGLVHISELSHKRVFRTSDVVKEGQEIEAKVLSVDPEAQRMSLSMKALEGRADTAEDAAEAEPEEDASPAKPPAKRTVPLKGGLGRSNRGEGFGLQW